MINNKEDIDKIKQLEAQKNDLSTDQRNKLVIGGIIGCIFFSIMFATQIISGFIALVLLLVGIPVVFIFARTIIKADPYIRQKTANELLKLQYKEAAKNAIYQLDNDVINKRNAIKVAKEKRDKVGGQIKTLEKQLDTFSTDSPYYKKMSKTLTTFKSAYELMKVQIRKAQTNLEDFELKVLEYKQYAKFTESAEAIAEMLDSEDTMSDMLSTVAFESIDQDFNSAIAAIENSVQDMEA